MAAGNKTSHGAHSEVPHKPNFPPFDQTTFSSQLVWLAICFVALYLFLSRIALPRVSTLIEQRSDRISRDLDEATRLKDETEKAIATYEQALAEARSKAHSIAQETRDTLQSEVNKEKAEVEQQIAQKLEEAESRITASKQAALAKVNDIASETTSALVDKLVSMNVSADDINEAVNASIKSS